MAATSSLQPNLIPESSAAGRKRWRFGALLVATGVGTGLAAAMFMGLLHAVQHAAWSYQSGDFLSGVERTTFLHRWIVLVGTGLLVLAAGFLLPQAKGGHGGEVTEAIWKKRARLPLVSTLVKGAFSIVVVGLGAALGREGPPKQAGAALGSFLAERFRLTAEQRRLLVACGAGAGVAAIYNVPLGGALFALEVLLGAITVRYVLPAVAVSGIATGTTWLFLPNRPTYVVTGHPATAALFPGAILVGVAAGLLSGVYIPMVAAADARPHSRPFDLASPVLVFVALAAAACFYPQVLGNGKNVVQLAIDNRLAFPLAAVLLFLRPLATAACLNCRAPGGLFTPTITVGALAGLLCGQGWQLLFPGEDPAVYALLGAAAFLAATSKGPVSALVLMLELTGRLESLLVPLMLAVALAMLVSRRLDPRSVYTVRIHAPGRATATRPASG